MKRYWGSFSNIHDVRKQFEISKSDILDAEIVFACYEQGYYDGSARVLFQRDGKLYEVSSSHCSCNGLDGSWRPSEVSWDQLAMREFNYCPEEPDAKDALLKVIRQHVPRA